MHKSISENLPGFMFPHEFVASLPADGEPREATPQEDDAFRRALLTIRGGLPDYMTGEIIERVQDGRLRDFRHYGDGSKLVRYDTPIKGSDNAPQLDVQFLVRLDADNKVMSYALTYDDLKPVPLSSWLLDVSGRGVFPMTTVDNALVLVRRHPIGSEFLFCPSKAYYHGLRIVPIEREGVRTYHVRLYCEHLPWTFQLQYRTDEEMERLVRAAMMKGLGWLMGSVEWEYWDASRGVGRIERMGVYMRLIFRRQLAEYYGDGNAIALLDKVEVRDVKTPPLWIRRIEAAWEENMQNIVRIARGPEELRTDCYKRPLTPLDCDRVVAYAALEGCPEAKADIASKFHIEV